MTKSTIYLLLPPIFTTTFHINPTSNLITSIHISVNPGSDAKSWRSKRVVCILPVSDDQQTTPSQVEVSWEFITINKWRERTEEGNGYDEVRGCIDLTCVQTAFNCPWLKYYQYFDEESLTARTGESKCLMNSWVGSFTLSSHHAFLAVA